jgi:hypothetical protein
MLSILETGSCDLFAHAGLEPWSSWWLGLQAWVTGVFLKSDLPRIRRVICPTSQSKSVMKVSFNLITFLKTHFPLCNTASCNREEREGWEVW